MNGEFVSDLQFTTDSCVDKTYSRLPTSLDFGTDSATPIYLCVMSSNSPPYLTGLTIVSGKLGKVSCPEGTTQSMDLNAGTSSGNIVYVCMAYTSASRAPVLIRDVLVVVGLNQLCPANYDKLAGNLNEGVLGGWPGAVQRLTRCRPASSAC